MKQKIIISLPCRSHEPACCTDDTVHRDKWGVDTQLHRPHHHSSGPPPLAPNHHSLRIGLLLACVVFDTVCLAPRQLGED